MSAIAGPEIEAKTVNTKTDNASNFFMIIILLRHTAAHIGMLPHVENRASHAIDIT
jgi:hypothetical protein